MDFNYTKKDVKIIKIRDKNCIRIYLNTNVDLDDYAKLVEEAPEMLQNLIGTAKALQRLLYQFSRDSIEYEWIGNAQESVRNATGKNLND